MGELHQDLPDSEWEQFGRLQGAALRGEAAAVPDLVAFLEFPNGFLQGSVADALGRIGDVRAVEPLLRLLTSVDDYARSCAVPALVGFEDERVVPALCRALRDDPSWSVREAAASALGRIGDESALPSLIAAMQDEDGDVREKVGRALMHFGQRALELMREAHAKLQTDEERARAESVIGETYCCPGSASLGAEFLQVFPFLSKYVSPPPFPCGQAKQEVF